MAAIVMAPVGSATMAVMTRLVFPVTMVSVMAVPSVTITVHWWALVDRLVDRTVCNRVMVRYRA